MLAYWTSAHCRKQRRRSRIWNESMSGIAAEACCDPHRKRCGRHFRVFRDLKHLSRKTLKWSLYVKRLSNNTPRNLATGSVGIGCPYNRMPRWGSGHRRRQKCTATVLVVENLRPFFVLHLSSRDTASCSWRDISRALEAEYQTARSSTNRDLPMAAGSSSPMSLIMTANRATLRTPPWGTPFSCEKILDTWLPTRTRKRRWAKKF